MKPPRKPRKTLRRTAVLLCSGLLAMLLIWRAPSYGEAQSIRKAPAKKDAAESTNNLPEPGETNAASPPPGTPAAEQKAPADAVETKVAVAADDPPKEGADGAEKGKAKDRDV